MVPSDRMRGDEHKLKHMKSCPNSRKHLFVYVGTGSVYVVCMYLCVVYVSCALVLCVGVGRCVLCVCFVLRVLCVVVSCVHSASFVCVCVCVCMCACIVFSCVFSVHRVVVQGCVWRQPALGSMGVPRGPKRSLSPGEAPDGVRGVWERGLRGTRGFVGQAWGKSGVPGGYEGREAL